MTTKVKFPNSRMASIKMSGGIREILGRAEELEAQKEELEKQLAHMDRIYEESHSAIARQLLAKIVAQ